MAEVSAPQAAEIVSTSHQTIWRSVEENTLPARRIGKKREIRIEIDDLRKFAEQYQYRFNEQLANQYAKR